MFKKLFVLIFGSEDDEDENTFLNFVANPDFKGFPCKGDTTNTDKYCKGCYFEKEHT